MLTIRFPNTADTRRGHFWLNAEGYNQRWGNFKVLRELDWAYFGGTINFEWKGEARFDAGPIALKSPMTTEIKFTYDVANGNLNGKFMKIMAGKEYSLTLAQDRTLPVIKIGT